MYMVMIAWRAWSNARDMLTGIEAAGT
jgi:hypothetical protein